MSEVVPSLRLFLLLTVLLIARNSEAQHAHYIYIQSENNQPYYVQVRGNTYSSNETGYLLIPQLPRGEYSMRIGFPKSMIEYGFNFSMGEEDRGFSLKQAVDNSWTLFDMVSFSAVKGIMMQEVKADKESEVDPAGAKKTAQKEGVIPVAAAAGEGGTAVIKVKKTEKVPGVQKIYEKTGPDGIDQVYVVQNGNRADTVILFIPNLTDRKDPAAFHQRNKEELVERDPAMASLALEPRKLIYAAK
ncbi:MAG: hypothetical protein NVS3B15_13270 [Sediminibacterium sp.]